MNTTLAGSNHWITSSNGEPVLIRLNNTAAIRKLQKMKVEELTDVELSTKDYQVLYPTHMCGKIRRVTVGPPT